MKELVETVNAKIAQMVEDGTVEKMIEERAEKAVVEILNDTFKSYGALYKTLKEKVEEGIDAAAWNFSIEPYTQVMSTFVQKAMADFFREESAAKLEESISTIFQPLPTEVTMQYLVTLIAKSYKEDDYDNDRDEHLSLECEESDYGWYSLKFWKQKKSFGHRENAPDIEMHINKDGEISWLQGGNRDYGTHNHGVEAILYRMSCKRTKITDIEPCNQDDFDDTYIGLGEDY